MTSSICNSRVYAKLSQKSYPQIIVELISVFLAAYLIGCYMYYTIKQIFLLFIGLIVLFLVSQKLLCN